MSASGQTKKFGKGERTVPTQKAQKWYPVDDEPQPKKMLEEQPRGESAVFGDNISQFPRELRYTIGTAKYKYIYVRKSVNPAKPRASLQPGTILILLAGRFRGKRVVLLKHLPQGVLLVTGPYKLNGVPLRRVNARYVIATSASVKLTGLDEKTLEKVSQPGYFTAGKSTEKKGEEAFFKQGEAPEKKKTTSERASDQKAVDSALLATIKKEEFLDSYLASSFSLRKGDRPHEMKW
ncbi:hypothetical protein TRV_01912 [Trichophyton verrucosum HKI 0517]|uniref:60S ribosomal protein L6 n=1 Tax=Trichophyton verrucosum (strain HKI 0517) TaxID=663202 RepID=D4D497_TRIVH|nr:uncharacterized protein TRV_01912 [Trichophyton verrucosum HKI 0517]EFE43352.1 hypothetical protein TRV_01912 [Trichophyton verrucosum HKI 0517]